MSGADGRGVSTRAVRLRAAHFASLVILLGIRALDRNTALTQMLTTCPVELLPCACDVDGLVLSISDPNCPARLPCVDWSKDGDCK